MGNGIYGENQGNESRIAGRGMVAVVMEEAGTSSVGHGREIEHMRALFNLGAWQTLAQFAKKLVADWGKDFLPPQRNDDETDKAYEKRLARFASDHYHRVVRKVQGMVSQATMGGSAMLASEGGNMKAGASIKLGDRPLVNQGGAKEDWNGTVAIPH